MSSNYPDDIDQYSHDVRSPCFEGGPECKECGEYMEVKVDADESGYYTVTSCVNTDCFECTNYKQNKNK
jgi:hypothetical protein